MSPLASAPASDLDQKSREFYRDAMTLMNDSRLPFLVGGAYAFAGYTGIERHTKDFDVFIRREDFARVQKIFEKAGYETELTFSHWIGKVFKGDDFVDFIYSAGNGVAVVDDLWFRHAVPGRVFDMDVNLIPAEEMIWSKGLIMERERYDGADVAHLIHAVGEKLDWERLLFRYGHHWRVLYTHLILFGFIYPSARSNVPSSVMKEFAARLAKEVGKPDATEKVCFGTLLSRQQYLVDVNEWEYKDARLRPVGNMSAEEIERWTAGIEIDGAK